MAKNIDSVLLKPGKEKALLHRHHWIFSGAIAQYPDFQDGDLLPVSASNGSFLGTAYFNRRSGIAGRMISFDQSSPQEAISQALSNALKFRKTLFDTQKTNAYRLVNGEGDFLPGLTIDCYGTICVIQIATLGMEKLKPFICEWLKKHLNPVSIYEKSTQPTRKEEGLVDSTGLLYGKEMAPVEVLENGLKFVVDIVGGQKTGFFCDHRNMRELVRSLSSGKRVLNCFSYTGGFSVYALAGGATQVDSVELSQPALDKARDNVALNGFDLMKAQFIQADAFDFLKQDALQYDLVILDPPAFAKKHKDIITACRGYKEINRQAMRKMPAGSLLLTCSCSYHVDQELFQKIVFQSAVEAGRHVRIIGRHDLAADHPVNLCHPEGDYLKSLLLYIQ